MITRIQAFQQLKSFEVQDWAEARRKAARKLPRRLRSIATHLLIRRSWTPDPAAEKAQLRFLRALRSLDGLSVRDREGIFEILFPRLSASLEAAWQLHARLPFRLGHQAKAFRAPNRPGLTRAAREMWFATLLDVLWGYDPTLDWLALWAPYLGYGGAHGLDILLAAAIEQGGEEADNVYDLLVASASGEHEIGSMGSHVVEALLIASRPEGWAFIERLLLAAQRQEGLRQVILESVDRAHPEAFHRMLRLILEHNLVRFPAVVRAVDVWFGFQWDSANQKTIQGILSDALAYLEDPEACKAAIQGDDPHQRYLGLWALAFEDAPAAVDPAVEMLRDGRVEMRFIGAHFLGQVGLSAAREGLLAALEDESLQVVVTALLGLQPNPWQKTKLEPGDLFERLVKIWPQLPKKMARKALVWPWMQVTIERRQAAAMLIQALGRRSPLQLLPFVADMDPNNRSLVVGLLAKHKRQASQVRRALLARVGDRSQYVRARAIEGLQSHADRKPLTPDEVGELEELLRRKSHDMRMGVMGLLLTQQDRGALKSTARLCASANPDQRAAGLELLRQMQEAGRSRRAVEKLTGLLLMEGETLSRSDRAQLKRLNRSEDPPTLEDGLGLYDPDDRTPPVAPETKAYLLERGSGDSLISREAIALLRSLDAWAADHRTETVSAENADGTITWELLGNRGLHAFALSQQGSNSVPLNPELMASMKAWWEQQGMPLAGPDRLGLVQAMAVLQVAPYEHPLQEEMPPWRSALRGELFGELEPRSIHYYHIIQGTLLWLIGEHGVEYVPDYLLDAAEHALARIPPKEVANPPKKKDPYRWGWSWREDGFLLGWLHLARSLRSLLPEMWLPEHHGRLFRLLRWLDEPAAGWPRRRPSLEETLAAHQAGWATEADLIELFLAQGHYYRYNDLWHVSGYTPHRLAETYPALKALVPRIRERIVEVELGRGDLPTAASGPVVSLRYAGGMAVLLQLLAALGRTNFVRGHSYGNTGKAATFSGLIQATFPGEDEREAQDFARAVKDLGISHRRLLELAVFAPQWAAHVSAALEWPGLQEAVWWLHAHTKDRRWHVDPEIREQWEAEISERTPLSGADLMDGAVDVTWFRRTYADLGSERWEQLYAEAKFASGGSGHTRARIFADAMLGKLDLPTLLQRVQKKRYQDGVRALGLVPLPEGSERAGELLKRYGVLQEFLRTSRKFGAQRRSSEKLAVRIGMENLARTAGYPDPRRLEWEMEAKETAELNQGSTSVTVGGVEVTLSVTSWGETELAILKNDRRLKHIPRRIKQNPEIGHLLELRNKVIKQGSRMRLALEEAMVRGDTFTTPDLQGLLDHAVLGPILSQLVFVGQDGLGFLVEGDRSLEGVDGIRTALSETESLRIAHPYDLFQYGAWHRWQETCFRQERIQPFKQIFRELYLLTASEKQGEKVSQRYAGQQVNPRQAQGLLGSRLWISRHEAGTSRTFHKEGITAHLQMLNTWMTPAEVDGVTIDGVMFTHRDRVGIMNLAEVPPRIFSEVMRDLDLVVSVAHRGGVDPEASTSTVEMRAALVRETVRLLKLENVSMKESWVLIEGQRGSYNVHLGSGVTHIQPGGALCMIPVHAQHRGRIFLPFADDDPKTAEVLAKVLLLSKDEEIKDPAILDQILR